MHQLFDRLQLAPDDCFVLRWARFWSHACSILGHWVCYTVAVGLLF